MGKTQLVPAGYVVNKNGLGGAVWVPNKIETPIFSFLHFHFLFFDPVGLIFLRFLAPIGYSLALLDIPEAVSNRPLWICINPVNLVADPRAT